MLPWNCAKIADDFLVYYGDALEVLKTLPDASVQCCVTSPPYWGLRDYQLPDQLGLEKTPQEYVEKLVIVFQEVKRVLKEDGTLWLNLGDCYNAHPGQRKTTDKCGKKQTTSVGANSVGSRHVPTIKAKDLVGIPWSVAFALRSDGWFLRSEIIWHKPNPMPESVTDRPTKAHEQIFLLAKSSKYYYDLASASEPCVTTNPKDPSYRANGKSTKRNRVSIPGQQPHSMYRTSGNRTHKYAKEYEDSGTQEHRTKAGLLKVSDKPWVTRNRRTVWTVSTQPIRQAHFATFPEKLIEPCILAGCPVGGTVLDPFNGSGTTGIVATRAGRSYIGVELNTDYIEITEQRYQQLK